MRRANRGLATQPETRKLQQVCYYQADIRMRSHRLLRGLMITSLLQVVNSMQAYASCFINLQQVCKYQVAASLIMTDLMKLTSLIQLGGNFHQVGKIHNLHQVCGVFGCVIILMSCSGFKTFLKIKLIGIFGLD